MYDAAGAEVALPCAYDDKPCAWKVALRHPAWTVKFWQSNLSKPLEQRIGFPPPELIEFLHLGVILAGTSNRPRAATPDPDFMRDVQDAIAELPEAVKVPLGNKLAGIFLVEDLVGSAWADQIFENNLKPIADRRPVAGMLALNVSALRSQTANSWATWKENTPFSARPEFRLTMQIAPESQNNRKNAIQYILLHELGHMFAIGNNIHPFPNLPPRAVRSTAQYPYFLRSWTIAKEQNQFISVFDNVVFPQRKDILYYGKPRLSADQMLGVYANLERTNFPTLYAAEHPADDFAEAFVTYVHTVLMKKPFLVTIYKNGDVARTYTSCWEAARCAEKRKILEQLLRSENSRPSVARTYQ